MAFLTQRVRIAHWLKTAPSFSLRWLLGGCFALLLILMLLLGLFAIDSERQAIEGLNKILIFDIGSADLSAGANLGLTRARRYEKDFLLKQREYGFDESRQRYLTLFRSNLLDAKTRLNQLAALSADPESAASARRIAAAIDHYERDFIEVVALQRQAGSIDSGLEGDVRNTARQIEKRMNDWSVTVVQPDLGALRLRENDYFQTGRELDRQLLYEAIDRFSRTLHARPMDAAHKVTLQFLVDKYRTSVQRFVQINDLVTEKKRTYFDALQSIEPGLDALTVRARSQSTVARVRLINNATRTEHLVMATNLFGVLAGILTAWFVYRHLTVRVHRTVQFARHIAANELATRIATTGQHEFGMLDVALNQMADALLQARITQEQKALELVDHNAALAREVDVRIKAQDALIDANLQLEQRVAERTLQLRQSNEELKKDIVARSKAELALTQSEQRFRHLADLSSDWYWEQDQDFRFSLMSRSETGKNGGVLKEFIGKTHWQMPIAMSDADWVGHKAVLQGHQPFVDLEYRIDFPDKVLRWFSISGEPVFAADGIFTGYRGTGRDITERKRTDEQIRHMALHDALTGLPNRSLLQDRIHQEIAQANRHNHPLWLLFIDLDRFKSINDSMGHKAGDALLVNIATRLQTVLRGHDTVARLGGDEFVLLLPDITPTDLISNVVQRILQVVAEPMTLQGQQIVVSCSIGVAAYPADGANLDQLMEHADIAMYRAKQNGRNNFQFYAPTMNAGVSERMNLEINLRQALGKNQFVLHYQPQVDLATNRIVGVEVLIRWLHPELGLVAPGRFIALAEETGLIVPIGAWVLKTACAQITAWKHAGYGDLRVAVNLSARQFAAPDLLQTIIDTLDENNLAPHHLDIELTESLLVKDVDHAVVLLHQLNQLGVHLSIDDFGTGYSSLAYLKRFPINVLKIDQSFVRDIAVDKTSEAIVSSIISLAHHLGIHVIAEGVEEQFQLDFLRHNQCDQMQGYFFSRAVPAADFEIMLRDEKTLMT